MLYARPRSHGQQTERGSTKDRHSVQTSHLKADVLPCSDSMYILDSHPYQSSYRTASSSLQEPHWRALLQHQRVPVHTGHQTQANGSPYGLCYLALVLRPQPRVFGVLYPPRLGHVFRHHGEVLLPSVPAHHVQPSPPTLYSATGLMPRTSKASLWGFLRPVFHFFCSEPDRSMGE
jgi:hypothetical protein